MITWICVFCFNAKELTMIIYYYIFQLINYMYHLNYFLHQDSLGSRSVPWITGGVWASLSSFVCGMFIVLNVLNFPLFQVACNFPLVITFLLFIFCLLLQLPNLFSRSTHLYLHVQSSLYIRVTCFASSCCFFQFVGNNNLEMATCDPDHLPYIFLEPQFTSGIHRQWTCGKTNGPFL